MCSKCSIAETQYLNVDKSLEDAKKLLLKTKVRLDEADVAFTTAYKLYGSYKSLSAQLDFHKARDDRCLAKERDKRAQSRVNEIQIDLLGCLKECVTAWQSCSDLQPKT